MSTLFFLLTLCEIHLVAQGRDIPFTLCLLPMRDRIEKY